MNDRSEIERKSIVDQAICVCISLGFLLVEIKKIIDFVRAKVKRTGCLTMVGKGCLRFLLMRFFGVCILEIFQNQNHHDSNGHVRLYTSMKISRYI